MSGLDVLGLRTIKTLGQTIRAIRRAKRLRIHELADQCGISTAHLSKIERGETNAPMPAIDRIAAALGTTTPALLQSTLTTDDEWSEYSERLRLADVGTQAAARFALNAILSGRAADLNWYD